MDHNVFVAVVFSLLLAVVAVLIFTVLGHIEIYDEGKMNFGESEIH